MTLSLELKKALENGGVGIIPTDTLYGLVGSALNPDTVSRIYELKHRDPQKPMIVLIGEVSDLDRFRVKYNTDDLKRYWPGPISLVLDCPGKKYRYLHRGTGTIAFRLPDKHDLNSLLRQVGPLVAPSANLEGEKPAETIEEAKRYFSGKVDFYVDGGRLSGKPSEIIRLMGNQASTIRP